MEFDNLWKFHAPVNIVEGFDVSLFDKLIEVRKKLSFYFPTRKNGLLCNASVTIQLFVVLQGSKLTNEEVNNETSHGIALEPHHLWEYPCRALTEEFTIMTFDFTSNIPNQKMTSEGNVSLKR